MKPLRRTNLSCRIRPVYQRSIPLAILLFASLELQAATYTCRIFSAPQFPEPRGINDHGDVSGTYSDSTQHGFLRRKDGSIIKFDFPGSSETIANQINDAGDIIGVYRPSPSDTYRAYIRHAN